MSDNFDDWLNSLDLGTSNDIETTGICTSQGQVHFHMSNGEVIDVPIIHEESPSESPVESVVVPQQPPEPEVLTQQDFNNLLTDIGIANPSEPADAEEIHDGSDDETNWNEESEGEEGGVTNPSTEELRNALESSPYLQESFDRIREVISETRGLDAEEDAEWEERDEPLIPENSPTLSIDDSTSRFSGTEWYEEIQKKKITFAGLGGIGSWSCLLIGRMALQTFILYDDDKVEMTNMSGQLYSRNQVGKYKVEAMRELISKYTSTISTFATRRRFTDDEPASDIMICGFDNMEARKIFFNSWMKRMRYMSEEQKKQCLFIDGRLSIDTLQVFCIQGNDKTAQERYESDFLFSDEEADETVCSMKQTSYLAAMIGSVITNLFTNWVANSIDPIIPYDLPFFTEYNAQHMIFKTEH